LLDSGKSIAERGRDKLKVQEVDEAKTRYGFAVGANLGSYNGSSCLVTFLVRFHNWARYFNWSASDKKFQLDTCLEGQAGERLE